MEIFETQIVVDKLIWTAVEDFIQAQKFSQDSFVNLRIFTFQILNDPLLYYFNYNERNQGD